MRERLRYLKDKENKTLKPKLLKNEMTSVEFINCKLEKLKSEE